MSIYPNQPTIAAVPSTARLRRILIVDDDLYQVKMLKAGLAKLPNCEIEIAISGQEALDLFSRQTFDLLITDYRMPNMNGLQLAQAVRQQYPRMHIIMLTAFSHEVLAKQTELSSVQLVLEKPVDLKHFRTAVQAALDTAAEQA
jgi:CheY-like chemotaxis protein